MLRRSLYVTLKTTLAMPNQAYKYRNPSDFDFTSAPTFRKTTALNKSQVQIADKTQEIITIINGKEETRNTANPGDYIVTGSQGEQYVIKAAKFPLLYQEDPTDSTRYLSKETIKALVLTEPTEITAPWGEKQRAEAGGVVAQRLGDPHNIYLIDKSAFEATYTKVAESAFKA